jgi:type IX secretion system PorP/SprF family membrane protein
MNRRKNHIAMLGMLLVMGTTAYSQDPHFSQFFAAPATVNPAYTGVFDGVARINTNFRQQWTNLGSPYTTGFASFDLKCLRNNAFEQNPFNVGVQLLSDRTLKGAFTANFMGASASYHIPLNREGNQSLGIGLSGSYGKRNVDFSRLASGSQFTSGGFDLTLPSGEIALERMEPFFAFNAGMVYTYNNREEGTFFDLGFGVFNVNQPSQTILYDQNEVVPMRFTGQANLQRYIQSDIILDVRLLYQNQRGVDYLAGGMAVSKLLNEEDESSLVGAGCWYRTGDAITPHVFLEYQRIRIGYTYDIQINDIRKEVRPGNSSELSLQLRFGKKDFNR